MKVSVNMNNNKGIIYLLLAALSFASFGIFSNLTGAHFDPFYQTSLRNIIVFALLLIPLILWKQFKKIKREDYKWFFIVGIAASLIVPFFHIAVINTSFSTTYFLLYFFSTIVSFIYGRIVFKEKFSRIILLSLLVSLIGMIMLYYGKIILEKPVYVLFGSLSGIFFGTYSIFSKKISLKYTNFQIQLVNSFFLFLVNIIISIALRESFNLNIASLPWFWNFIYALAAILATGFTIVGFKYINAQKGSLVLLSELVFVMILGFFIYNEESTLLSILGSLLIIIAMGLPNIVERDKKHGRNYEEKKVF